MRDDGIVFICDLINKAENGDMPKEELNIRNRYWFENRTIGATRYYAAQGVNQRVDRLVRIPLDMSIQPGQYAVLGNGEQFRITMVASGQDSFQRTKMIDSKYYRQPEITGLKYTELTLTRLENYYEFSAPKN